MGAGECRDDADPDLGVWAYLHAFRALRVWGLGFGFWDLGFEGWD